MTIVFISVILCSEVGRNPINLSFTKLPIHAGVIMSLHTFCHAEWAVTDLARAKAFLGGLFDWKFEAYGDEYLMFSTPSEEFGGGLMKSEKVLAGASPTVYVHVKDVQSYLDKVVTLGGKVCVPKTEIPGMGWFGILTDPDGNAFGVYQSLKDDYRHPFHSFCHVEWSVTDGGKARSFFGGLFDWKFSSMGENYTGFMTPSENVGGGFMQEKAVNAGQSPCVYVFVEAIEPYLQKAVALGGQVAMPKTEIPGMGWFALLNDLDNNIVGIFESARKDN